MKLIQIDTPELDKRFRLSDNNAFALAVKELSHNGLTVATAESCTGGLIGKMFTDVPGASAVFVGGMITYTNRIKINSLGVKEETIAAHTEVSAECASEMAERARTLFASDLAISATGFAGPTGGNERDGVGTVYLGIAIAKETVVYRLCFGHLSREDIRTRTALFAAKELVSMMKKG